ncbi:MAG: hypothetical protein HY905_13890 [Deltaproteobacteria bacterium]|nr:hypothetical protein [Deltaproteobacteria bacterium]
MTDVGHGWPYKGEAPAGDLAGEGTLEEAGKAIERLRPRDVRRTLGQFWTPDPIAECMVRWALRGAPGRFLDPGAGPLTFLRAAERLFGAGRASCIAFELDPDLGGAARRERAAETCELRVEDFLRTEARFPAMPVVCNPPYTRHHRLRDDVKRILNDWADGAFGFRPSGFLGTYGWFFLRALDATAPASRLCFLTPVELLTSGSGLGLFRALPERFWPRRLIVFGTEFDAFPGVDATAAVSFVEPGAAAGEPQLLVLRSWPRPSALAAWLDGESSGADLAPHGSVSPLAPRERPATAPARNRDGPRVALSEYAGVTRGVATGANAFFLFGGAARNASGIEGDRFVRVIARARDARRLVLTEDDLEALERRGRPTYLLALARDAQPDGALARQLARGQREGLHERPLLSRRRPWWATEAHDAPAILFTYLSRGDPRFVLNEARAAALTTFLAVRPRPSPAGVSDEDWRVCLVAALNGPGTLASLAAHARSYGGATRKLEPRELERVELPALSRLASEALAELARRARGWLPERSLDARRAAAAEWEAEVTRRLGGE